MAGHVCIGNLAGCREGHQTLLWEGMTVGAEWSGALATQQQGFNCLSSICAVECEG